MVIRDEDADTRFWKLHARGGLTSSFSRALALGFGAVFLSGIHSAGFLTKLVFVRGIFACTAGWRTTSFGKITAIFVPLPRELTIFSSPPISCTRSRIPVRPTPSCRSLTRNPSPSSQRSRRSSFALEVNRVRNCLAWAYFRVLLKASWPIPPATDAEIVQRRNVSGAGLGALPCD